MNYAQSLYEKRLITYPRTDSRFLTEDMAESLPGLASGTAAIFGAEEKLLVHVQQVINGSKVTDHHALLPTASVVKADLSALPAGEMSILRLIAARLLCAVGEPYRYVETVLTTICAGEEFSAKGKVVFDEGWKSIERRVLGDLLSKKKEPAALPDVQKQSRCSIAGAELKEGQTSPPKHYNEDLLLSAMQSAGADSMEDDVERTGIGTPATRAATIEKLVQKGFLERKGDTGYSQYMTAFNRNFGGSSGGGGGGGNHNNNGGGGGDGSGCGCLIAIAVVVVLILIVLGGRINPCR